MKGFLIQCFERAALAQSSATKKTNGRAKPIKLGTTVASKKERSPFHLERMAWLGLVLLLCGFPSWARQSPIVETAESALPGPYLPSPDSVGAATAAQQADQQTPGSITGTVVDQSGAAISGVLVKLTREGQTSETETFSDDDGLFHFSSIAPGP